MEKQIQELRDRVRNSSRLATFYLKNGDVQRAVTCMASAKQVEIELLKLQTERLQEAAADLTVLRSANESRNGHAHAIALG